jgi:CheY-like chemotaxis protein/HPt (histidine-containing phosphotransfer) domain-containing protein
VLVVEDNPVNAAVTEGMLLELGCTTAVVDNGREAVARVRAERFDLVLMDLHMPELDGLGATALIRKAPAGDRHLPIIALTANAADTHRQQCLAAGMDGFLGKPFTMSELHDTLARWLPENRGHQTNNDDGSGGRPRACVLDSSALARIRALDRPGRPSLFARVATLFVTGSTGQVEIIRDALARGDLPAVRAQAHSLKSASANVGAMELARLALALERACDRGDASEAQSLGQQLSDAHPAVVIALQQESLAESA